jgi:hypothetical protein
MKRMGAEAKRANIRHSLPQTIYPTPHGKIHAERASRIKQPQLEIIKDNSLLRVETAYGNNRTSYVDGWII